MQGGQVDLLRVDELVSRRAAQVFDIVDEEEVRGGVLGEEDDLGAALGELVDDGGANAGCAALEAEGSWISARERSTEDSRGGTYRDHDDLGVHHALGGVARAAKVVLERGEQQHPGRRAQNRDGIWDGRDALGEALDDQRDGHGGRS